MPQQRIATKRLPWGLVVAVLSARFFWHVRNRTEGLSRPQSFSWQRAAAAISGRLSKTSLKSVSRRPKRTGNGAMSGADFAQNEQWPRGSGPKSRRSQR